MSKPWELVAELNSANLEIMQLQSDIEVMRAALKEIAAVYPQSWTTERAILALKQITRLCAYGPGSTEPG